MSETAGFIIQEILAERKRQNVRFGQQNHFTHSLLDEFIQQRTTHYLRQEK